MKKIDLTELKTAYNIKSFAKVDNLLLGKTTSGTIYGFTFPYQVSSFSISKNKVFITQATKSSKTFEKLFKNNFSSKGGNLYMNFGDAEVGFSNYVSITDTDIVETYDGETHSLIKTIKQ